MSNDMDTSTNADLDLNNWTEDDTKKVLEYTIDGGEKLLDKLLEPIPIPFLGSLISTGVGALAQYILDQFFKPAFIQQQSESALLTGFLYSSIYSMDLRGVAGLQNLVTDLNTSRIEAVYTSVYTYQKQVQVLRSQPSVSTADWDYLRKLLDKAINDAQDNAIKAHSNTFPQLSFPTEILCYTIYYTLLRDKYLYGIKSGYSQSEIDAVYTTNFTDTVLGLPHTINDMTSKYNTILKGLSDFLNGTTPSPNNPNNNSSNVKFPYSLCGVIACPFDPCAEPELNGQTRTRFENEFYDEFRDSAKCLNYMLDNPRYVCPNENNNNTQTQIDCKNNHRTAYIDSIRLLTPVFKWNYYNQIRRLLTIGGLDIMATWQYLDPIKYPNGTKTDITRTIYSDIAGVPRSTTISDIDKQLLKPITLFETLNSSTWYTEHLSATIEEDQYTANESKNPRWIMAQGEYVVGIQNQCRAMDRLTTRNYPQQGKTTNQSSSIPNSISSLEISQWKFPRKFTFKDINISLGTIEETYPAPIKKIYADLTYDNFLLPNHNVAWFGYDRTKSNAEMIQQGPANPTHFQVYSLDFIPDDNEIGALSIGLSRADIDFTNTITNNATTAIPAVKAFDISDGDKPGVVITGPGYTGNDLVKLPPGGRLKMQLNYEQANTWDVRIRYIATADTRIEAGVNLSYRDNKPDQYTSNNFTVKSSTTSLNNLQFTDFGYTDIKALEIQNLDIADYASAQYFIKNTGSVDIILDKIEFTPAQPTFNDHFDKIIQDTYNPVTLWSGQLAYKVNITTFDETEDSYVSLFFYKANVLQPVTKQPSATNIGIYEVATGFDRIDFVPVGGDASGGHVAGDIIRN